MMKPHPPLCPRTEPDEFEIHNHIKPDCHIRDSTDANDPHDEVLWLWVGVNRRLLARYQACAWQDRYDSLRAMWYMFDADDPESGPTTFEASGQALKNAAAWRQWERGE